MTVYEQEQLQIIRRLAERGKKVAFDPRLPNTDSLDVFQAILDELQRLPEPQPEQRK